MKINTQKVLLTVPEDAYRKFETYCAKEGYTVQDMIRSLIRGYIFNKENIKKGKQTQVKNHIIEL